MGKGAHFWLIWKIAAYTTSIPVAFGDNIAWLWYWNIGQNWRENHNPYSKLCQYLMASSMTSQYDFENFRILCANGWHRGWWFHVLHFNSPCFIVLTLFDGLSICRYCSVLLHRPCGDRLPRCRWINALAPGQFEWNIRHAIFKQILVTDGWGISC